MKYNTGKLLLIGGLLGVGLSAHAQKSKIGGAQNYLQEGNYKKAKELIDEAVAPTASTADDPAAWLTRAQVYFLLAADTTKNDPSVAQAARASLMRTLELKPNYDPNVVNPMLYTVAVQSWNTGLSAYNGGRYEEAYTAFKDVSTIYQNGGASRWKAGDRISDAMITLNTESRRNAALAAVQAGKDAEATTMFEEIVSANPKGDKDLYIELLRLYSKANNNDKYLATARNAMAAFPEEKAFRDAETQYYINSGNTAELISKLEANKAKDPGNADYLFILGTTYYSMAFPENFFKDDYVKPATFDENYNKAEQNLLAAVAAKDEAMYNYNVGVLYFNKGNDFIRQMNAIKGMSKAETDKYNALEKERNASFAKAVPYLEKAVQQLEGRSDLSDDDKTTYSQSVVALVNIFSRQDNKAKLEVYKAKRDAAK